MITVQLPPSTLVEQERLRHSQNELLRAKQELQWEQLQVQQHEKIARERCISAILAAHKRERVSFEKLCQLSTEVQSDASRWHELLRLISEAYRRSHVFSLAPLCSFFMPGVRSNLQRVCCPIKQAYQHNCDCR
jgi:hypothetical protein